MSARLDSNSVSLPDYVLRLFVTGHTPRSLRAVDNIRRICETHLKGNYGLEVIDLYQQPELAAKHHIVATPTLVKSLPPPLRRLIGDLSDTAGSLRRLGIAVTTEEHERRTKNNV